MGSEYGKMKKRKDEEDIILEGHIIGHPDSALKKTNKILELMNNSVCKIIKEKQLELDLYV